jgi:signal transduction histidine kinase
VFAVFDLLPRGNTLSDEAWGRRHLFLQWVLLLHVPALLVFGVLRGEGVGHTAAVLVLPFACLVLSRLASQRRLASCLVTGGLVSCSVALVHLAGGAIEAHFHYFVLIGFIALYHDWVPFLAGVAVAVLSHVLGSAALTSSFYQHPDGHQHAWAWTLVHVSALLAACAGLVTFWKATEDEQRHSLARGTRLAEAELTRRRHTANLLANLARRNQPLLHRQLGLLNRLEDDERDPDALANLFQLEHLATRIRRNAESLQVLAGEDPPRTWSRPVPLVDVVRAAIAEIEDLDRVDFAVDEVLAVGGRAVADVTHLLAELIENAVRFSPPGVVVMLRTRPYLQSPGAAVLTIEDWGAGMSDREFAEANAVLRGPLEIGPSTPRRLGLHVAARLAARHQISVSLSATPGGGVTAGVLLPASLLSDAPTPPMLPPGRGPAPAAVVERTAAEPVQYPPAAPQPARATGPAPEPAPSLESAAPTPATERGPAAEPEPARRTPVAGPERAVAEVAAAVLPPTAYGRTAPVAPGTTTIWTSALVPQEDNWRSWWTPRGPHAATATPFTSEAAEATAAEHPAPRPTAPGLPAPGLPAPGLPAPEATAAGLAQGRTAAEPPKPPPPPVTVPTAHSSGAHGATTTAAGTADAAGGSTARTAGAQGPVPGLRLSRRVPQASLAVELRSRPLGIEAAPIPDPVRTREALSRFQARQRAGRAVVEAQVTSEVATGHRSDDGEGR